MGELKNLRVLKDLFRLDNWFIRIKEETESLWKVRGILDVGWTCLKSVTQIPTTNMPYRIIVTFS